jgi:uncharacterized coiled-coil protein SlyX
MTIHRYPPQDGDGDDESTDLFDYALLKHYLGFIWRAIWRRKGTAFVIWVLVVAATAGALVVLPKSYHCETKLQAQRNQVIASLSNPGRSVPYDADAPARMAAETVLRSDNLVALVKGTELVKNWNLRRAPILRFKDFLLQSIGKAPTEEAMTEALVGYLEKQLAVTAGDGTVSISIDWPDAEMAYQLVETAQQNFLEARHAAEISVIAEAISILQGHAATVREGIEAAVEEIQKNREVKAARGGASAARAQAAAHRRVEPPSQEVTQLQVMAVAKKRAIDDLEDFRRRRLNELQARLAEQRATYSEAHPIVVDIQQSIDAMTRESPQIAALQRELAALEQELVRRGKPLGTAPPGTAPTPISNDAIGLDRERDADDPSIEYSKSQMRFAIQKHTALLERIDSAKIELDTARAAFKYRYSVLRPATVPHTPAKPKAGMVLAAGIIGGLFLAILAAAAIDIRSGRIIERWQAEQNLKLPVLAHFRKP